MLGEQNIWWDLNSRGEARLSIHSSSSCLSHSFSLRLTDPDVCMHEPQFSLVFSSRQPCVTLNKRSSTWLRQSISVGFGADGSAWQQQAVRTRCGAVKSALISSSELSWKCQPLLRTGRAALLSLFLCFFIARSVTASHLSVRTHTLQLLQSWA